MKNKEDLIKKSDNNSEQEESKRQDEGSVQKVQRMDSTKVQNKIQLKQLEKMAQLEKANEESIGQKEPSEYEPQPSKKIHTEDYNDLRIIQYLEDQVSKNNIQEGVIERLSPNFFNKDALTLESRLTDDLKFYAHCSMCLETLNPGNSDYYVIAPFIVKYKDDPKLNNRIIGSRMGAADDINDRELTIEGMKNYVSGLYKACVDHSIKLSDNGTLLEVIENNVKYIANEEYANEIIGDINNFYIE